VTTDRSLPIHFFTIVLDGEPFIRHHIEVFNKLQVPWHWHIVEGLASLTHDTSWGADNGGRAPTEAYPTARSGDGTSGYLDGLARTFPDKVTVYRKPLGELWDGKIEMVRAPLAQIGDSCLLWQIDSDELWTAEQFHTMHSMFVSNPERFAAWFWCHYFVGPNRVVASRNCYTQNPNQEWLRVWRYHPGMQWVAHEPPILATQTADGKAYDVGRLNPFMHSETEAAGLVFQHMSYTTEAQVRFKELYYGYSGAVERWKDLQADTASHVLLQKHLPWVKDATIVEFADRKGIIPLMAADGTPPLAVQSSASKASGNHRTRVVIDGVFFQLNSTGIARVWHSVLERWSKAPFASEILLLDRAGTAPRLPGLRYLTIPEYHCGQGDSDRSMLQDIIDRERGELFASTYYTSVVSTKTLQVVYDMIPEVLGYPVDREPAWLEKHYAFRKANYFLCISHNTRADLHRFFPEISRSASATVHLGVDQDLFHPASPDDVVALHRKYSLMRPYFLLCGSGHGYKNAHMAVEALGMLPSQHGFEIVIATRAAVPAIFRDAINAGIVRVLPLSDEELRIAYSGAVAFLYPSLYEGFGLPILEAMACNCPVIANNKASLPEVAGEAALYASDSKQLAAALCEVQKPEVQNLLIQAGRERVAGFSWDRTASSWWDIVCALTSDRSVEGVDKAPTTTSLTLVRELLS
jgi:glycosyltransferase involved in cell wall biosynthesis